MAKMKGFKQIHAKQKIIRCFGQLSHQHPYVFP
jgi:hypothetical protein